MATKSLLFFVGAGILVLVLFFVVPSVPSDVRCITLPCPPERVTPYDFILQSMLDVEITEPIVCIQIFDPVCGVDGMTYSNECFAGSVEIAHRGMCLSDEEEEGMPIAQCIDGLNFGVCTGEPIFNIGQPCYFLSTQQCFDKCITQIGTPNSCGVNVGG